MGNAEASKEKILDAAMAEFSEFGVAGARVERIARNAGCNKNLIYVYFESKEKLFTTVLQKNLLRVYDDIEFDVDDLPGYAGRVFDFAMAHPDLLRLMAWSSLEQKTAQPAERGQLHSSKVAEILQAQEEGRVGTDFPPAFLLTSIMTVATAWSAANPFGTALNPEAAEHPDELRATIARLIATLSSVPAHSRS